MPNAQRRSLDLTLKQLTKPQVRRICEELETGALELGLWSEERGEPRPLRLAARPWIVSPATVSYLSRVGWQIRTALRRVSELFEQSPQLAAALPLEPPELRCLRSIGEQRSGPGERLFCRLDALGSLDSEKELEGLKFVEVNVVGIGGMTYAPAAPQLLTRTLERLYPVALTPLADPRDLLVEEILEHAAALGLKRPPRVALLDDQRLYKLGGEMGRLAGHLLARGLEARAVDVREIEKTRGGTYCCGDFHFDLIYRFLELRELAELDWEGGGLATLWSAFREGRVLPTLAGDLDHKSVFEPLTCPEFGAHLTVAQREACARHVLWTRLLYERFTLDARGREIDLFPYAEREQQQLVLKPNRECGGVKVVLGALVTPKVWRETLEEAFEHPSTFVVQQATEPTRETLPCLEPTGEVDFQERFVSLGLFPGAKGLGALGRFSDGPVVNISQGGGVIPVVTGAA